MQITSGVREQYNPARIYNATTPNANHISEPSFTDQELGKPERPAEPSMRSVDTWLPIGETFCLLILTLFLSGVPPLATLAFLAIPIVWVWAFMDKLPKYEREKGKAEREHQEALHSHQRELEHFERAVLPEWQEKVKPQILGQKKKEWMAQAIDHACRSKYWRVHSIEEVEETRSEGFIGPGEDEVVEAITASKVQVRHQVRIQYSYTADIICFNAESGKLCVVEIDGSQHWKDEGQIERDNNRMEDLASKGVPTIRFVNMYARNYPNQCVKHIQNLLA